MFCPSCGTQNPEGAKFCAKCGAAMAAKPETAGSPTQPVSVQPPQPAPAPKPAAASSKEPLPGVPGQTQFFMAAAGVSTGAKIKRLIIFTLVVVAICLLVILGIRFTKEQARKKEAAAKQQQDTEAVQQPVPTPAPAPAENK